MTRLPGLRPREVAAILEKSGFTFIRQRGSHRIYVKEHVGVIVPWHGRDLKKGTLRHIIKQSGLTPDEFIGLHRS
jgi:predicted RNA binding protein YcfA (HicA-like mRNA interferase family)